MLEQKLHEIYFVLTLDAHDRNYTGKYTHGDIKVSVPQHIAQYMYICTHKNGSVRKRDRSVKYFVFM